MEKFWGENVRSSPTSITSGRIDSTESHVILGGGVAVCLLLSAHRAVIFAISQRSCRIMLQVSEPPSRGSVRRVRERVEQFTADDVQRGLVRYDHDPTQEEEDPGVDQDRSVV